MNYWGRQDKKASIIIIPSEGNPNPVGEVLFIGY